MNLILHINSVPMVLGLDWTCWNFKRVDTQVLPALKYKEFLFAEGFWKACYYAVGI